MSYKYAENETALQEKYIEVHNAYGGLSQADLLLGFATAMEEAVTRGVLTIDQAGDIMQRSAQITQALHKRNGDILDVIFGPKGIQLGDG